MRLITYPGLNPHMRALTWEFGPMAGLKANEEEAFQRRQTFPRAYKRPPTPGPEYRAMIEALDLMRGFKIETAIEIIALHSSRIDAEYRYGD